MNVLGEIIDVLDWKMNTPQPYGWFHLLCCALTIIAAIIICILCKHKTRRQVIAIVFGTAIIVAILEIYKQINFTFSFDGKEITSDFLWFAFPWQFCSMPMYVGLLAGIFRKGKIHESLCAFLATYSIFAGVCVMVYPVTVFAIAVFIATIMNEIAYYTGLLKTDEFNMFFISPHCDPSLPVYSIVQEIVPYPLCLFIYVAAFTLAAYVMLLISMLVRTVIKRIYITNKQVDASY